jgi:hypothetical protein
LVGLVRKQEGAGFWNTSVRDYYINKRKVPKTILDLIHNRTVSDVPSITASQNIEMLKKSKKWTRILADFGEASASWFLECNESFFMVKLRWVEFPLKVAEGIDVIGFRVSNEEISISEAKTTSELEISSTVSKLSKQLRCSRIEEELCSPMNQYGSKAWLVEQLVNQGIISEAKVDEILSKTDYVRYGFVFHSKDTVAQFNHALQTLQAETQPITFVDYALENFDFEIGSFVELLIVSRDLAK